MKKNYVLDTNVLLENENCIEILRNGEENDIFIPATVIEELDKLKRDKRKRHQVMRAINALNEYKEHITIIHNGVRHDSPDNFILKEIQANLDKIDDPIFVSNDNLLRFKAEKEGMVAEDFKNSNPFESESQRYTGFVNVDEGEALEKNCYYWKEGKLHFNSQYGEEVMVQDKEVWKVAPRTAYQKAAIDLITNEDIDLITIQSEAGFGKTFIALASMFDQAFEKKNFKKIFIFKANIEIGNDLGFLPGDVNEKMYPYFRPIQDLMEKLHELRPANRVWEESTANNLELNRRSVEMLPINFLRGMNVDNSIVLIDEVQNLSRDELRTVLSRMGENVKVICTGDVRQIDNIHLNQENNGLNWMVRLFKGQANYGHVVLGGNKSRGPIADLVRESGL
jgi:PhoH-like ATPase